MKNVYTFLLVLIVCMIQTAPAQNTCSSPYLFSSGAIYTVSAVTGVTNTDTTNNYGCLVSVNNPTWYYLKICQAGSIDISISATGSGGSAIDVDYIAWGPLTAETDCGLDSSQIVYCDASAMSGGSIYISGAATGQYYKFMITNYSGNPGTYTIASGATETGMACDSAHIICDPVTPQQICQVTTDPVTNHNTIIWNKDPAYMNSYAIEKESTTMGVYVPVATIAYNDTSAYTDTVSNAMIQAFRYRIVTTDNCANPFSGPLHETIHLLVSSGVSTGYPQLSWNPYTGFSYGTYYIYRGTTTASLSLYDSISASFTTYTDVSPLSGTSYYAVSVTPPAPCHPTRSFSIERVFSNAVPAAFTGIAENAFSDLMISPNPATSEISFTTENNRYNSIDFEICDVTGRRLLGRQYENTSKATIDVSGLSNGYYIARFITEKGAAQRMIIIAR